MKLSLIPSPYEISYLPGFSSVNVPVETVVDRRLPAEGFVLHIAGRIRISASSDAGFFYAENLLEQIKFQCGQNLPNVHIRDFPKYSYRSFMIDSCRHFMTAENIRRMIDHCAKLRLNVFHWHLTDDQGWRIEIKKHPELTAIGSVRYGNHFGEEQNEDIHSGFYTQEQIREIVEYAHARHMAVVPEIDMPGHASALLASISELVCGNKKVEIKTENGIFKDVICAGKDENFDVIYEILDEVCELFPDEYIHIGGDEAPKEQWKKCPDCQTVMITEELKNEDELQGYFINRVKSYLDGKGKKVITWNESLKGGNLDSEITVQQWMDPKNLCKNCKNPLIVSDFFHYYADYPYAMTPLKKVYEFDHATYENVIGVDTPIWTEYVSSIEKAEYMCFPRFIAVAQTAWCRAKPTYQQFRLQLRELTGYFGIENMAPEKDWDPPTASRLPSVIKHFARISKNKTVRDIFF